MKNCKKILNLKPKDKMCSIINLSQMKKIMNFRPFVLFALSLILGIILATFVFVTENLKLVFLIIFLLMFACSIILVVIFKAKFLKYLSVCLLLIVVPVSQMYGMHKKINSNMQYNEMEVVIAGRICSNYKFTSSGNLSLMIDNVEIVGADFKDKIDGKVQIYARPEHFDLAELEIGRFISAFGVIRINNFNDGSDYVLSNLSNEIVASSYVSYSSFSLKDEYKTSIDEKVRSEIYAKLKSFNIHYADIGYAMLFGDSSTIDADVISAFRTTGIAHILAVSGLHVSIVAMFVSFILKIFKCPKNANVVVMAIVLLIYSYLCNFSVSVVRASVMTLMYLYLKARGKCYDRLSALSLSACVILLINPIKLYNISFILSFMAVLSITLLTDVFEWLFDKCFHKKMSASMALIFAVQVGLVFVQLYFFKNYTPLSIVCNFISVPVSMLAFDVLIVGLIISSMLPFMSFIVLGYDYLMGLVVKFNYTLSKVGFAFAVNNLNFLIIIFGMAIVILLSNYVFIKKRYKAVGITLFVIFSTILLFVW